MANRALITALVGAATCILGTAAQAATTIRTYQITSAFTGAPVASVTQRVTLTLDLAATGTNNTVTIGANTNDSGISAFAPPSGTGALSTARAASGSVPSLLTIQLFGKAGSGAGVDTSQSDFLTVFDIDRQGNPTSVRTAPMVYYSVGSDVYYTSTRATVTDITGVSAVPEPATWAMMIAGFALAGAALRRRRIAEAAVA